eukprot:scaffold6162_cov116-Isochrysis_galbana.AAC.11
MSISSYASDHSAASQPHSQAFSLSTPSRQSGMVQPVVQEMLATVHAALPPVRLFSVYSVHVQPSIRQDPKADNPLSSNIFFIIKKKFQAIIYPPPPHLPPYSYERLEG